MGWYLGVIEKIHNDECITYISTGEVLNGTPNIFNKLHYYFCYEKNI